MSELYRDYTAGCSIQICSHTIGQKAKPALSRGFWGEDLRGFCTSRSTTEQIFILRQSLEKCYKMELMSTGFLLIINRLLKVKKKKGSDLITGPVWLRGWVEV